MEFKILGKENDIALIITDEIIIKDAQSALDLIATVQYETDCDKIIIHKSCVTEDFFILSTGIAGEILQKFINYRELPLWRLSRYQANLLDFIKSNKGNSIYFVTSLEEACLLDSAQ